MTGWVKATGLGLALQLAVFAGALAAQSPVDSLFPARPTGYLTDVAGVVDAASAATIDSIASRLRSVTGAEFAVVTLPTIGDYAASDVALAIGRAWGVGRAAQIGDATRNAGLVILVVPRREGDPNSGHIFISTGQGLEGIVTDAAAGRVRDAMVPELRAGQYGPGLVTGTRLLAARVARGLGATDSTLTTPGGRPDVSWGLLLFLFIVAVVVVVTMIRASRGGGPPSGGSSGGRRTGVPPIFWGGGGGRWGGGGGFGGGGGGFGGFGGGGGFSGGGAGGRF
ncbi:MAG: TPM domain-containing protein [Gemmatimonadales bacterium]